MSGESELHRRLVERLVDAVRRDHNPPRGLLVLADHPDFGADRPPSIGGFLPDLFASDLPATFEIIGEAKTVPDLETDRSARQLRGFLDHLCLRPRPFFYLTVPPFWGQRARSLLRSLQGPQHQVIDVRVIDGL